MGFVEQFLHTAAGMGQIILIAAAGWLFARMRLFSSETINACSGLTIGLFLPALIFNNLVFGYDAFALPLWWLYPLLGVLVSAGGALLSGICFRRLDRREFLDRTVLLAFQNCGYLPLILVSRVCQPGLCDALTTAILLFIQGFNLCFWTIGVRLISQDKRECAHNKLLQAPLLALIISFVIRWLGLQSWVPASLHSATDLLSNCTLPMAILVLGGILAHSYQKFSQSSFRLGPVIFLKMVVMPLVGLLIILVIPLDRVMALLLLIELAMPAAINVGVVAQFCGVSSGRLNYGVFLMHVVGIFTIPLFLTIGMRMAG